jgi:hypothetical protein
MEDAGKGNQHGCASLAMYRDGSKQPSCMIMMMILLCSLDGEEYSSAEIPSGNKESLARRPDATASIFILYCDAHCTDHCHIGPERRP